MTSERSPHSVRFGLLAHLCYTLRERQDCTSLLANPRRGECVLWVPYPAAPQRRLGVAAVDHHGRWLYAFGDRWSMAEDPGEAAAHVAWAVKGR
ncbi:hypothetical protein [Actinomadura sp. WMMB 499]|uniref:hypothetical protein n=1 Tax=Actinomadura sp. WMMB 499 TaxID=1219491 RepID=UPI00159E2CD2|nr:hypothetical protein [Actinomadura sp. WMMB 499]